MEEMLDRISFDVDMPELYRQMRTDPDSDDGKALRDTVERCREVANPKAAYRVCFIDSKDEEYVTIEGITMTSRVLAKNLEKAERVFAYIATCGTEIDDGMKVQDGDFMTRFWVDSIKEMALHAACEMLKGHLEDRFAIKDLSSMNPGSGHEQLWRIEQQKELFRLLGDTGGLTGVVLTESCLMIPNKSISGIYYQTDVDFNACRLCAREKCRGRRAAYDRDLWESYERQDPDMFTGSGGRTPR